MLRRVATLVASIATLLAVAPAANAAPPDLKALFGDCPAYGDDATRVCSGQVPSWDGSSLDVDLTLPAQGTSGPHPLIVMLHGFGNNKHEWESTTDEGDGADKYHWNSHWFSRKGYYVLTYTARGFCRPDTDCSAYEDYQPETPGGTSAELPSGTLHLKSREFEVRDTQWRAALAAGAFDVDTRRVAVTGGSYGGGESWLQASQPQWTFPHEQEPSLPVLDLQVAIPKYPWTDLAYSLAPHGHAGGPGGSDLYESSQGRPDSPAGTGYPVGVTKESYIAGLSALGYAEGIFEAGTTVEPPALWTEGPIDVPAWTARSLAAGDPYDAAGAEDPVIAQLRRGLTEYRSAYYQDEAWAAQASGRRRVAVFSIQGWTDDLFPALESFRQFKYLKRLNPKWPVEVLVADVGHSRAQNRPQTWEYVNGQANQWLASNIGGSTDQQTKVTSLRSTCPQDPGNELQTQAINATSPEGLAQGKLTIGFARGGTLNNPLGVQDPNGTSTDPVFAGLFTQQEPCRVSPGPATGGYTATSAPLSSTRRYAGLGHVSVPYSLAGATTATLQARVWDVGPDGQALLVTRGTYRIDLPAYDTPAGVLRLPLFGNDWVLRSGHSVRLDLTQDDHPTFRPSNEASSIAFQPPTLVLPTRESGTVSLAGA
jgi:hypothetical protein